VIFLNLDFEANSKGVNYVLKRARKAAVELKGKLRVAVAGLSDMSYELDSFGLSTKSKADVLMGITDASGDYYAPAAGDGRFSASAMAEFARAYAANELTPYVKPPPADDDGAGYGDSEDADYDGGEPDEADEALKEEP